MEINEVKKRAIKKYNLQELSTMYENENKAVYFAISKEHGKVGDAEVDFLAINSEGEEYYQVSQTVLDEQTLKRELASLEAVKDHNPKFLLTMDYQPLTFHNGIKQMNVLDWLSK